MDTKPTTLKLLIAFIRTWIKLKVTQWAENRKLNRKIKGLKKAKRKARKLHEATGKTIYVFELAGSWKVADNRTIKELNRKLPKSKRITHWDLLNKSAAIIR